jgi:hypothetical protein
MWVSPEVVTAFKALQNANKKVNPEKVIRPEKDSEIQLAPDSFHCLFSVFILLRTEEHRLNDTLLNFLRIILMASCDSKLKTSQRLKLFLC